MAFGPRDPSVTNPLALVETKPNEQNAKKISDEAAEQDRFDRLFDEIEDLKLTDPSRYEALLGGDLGGVNSS